MLKKQTTGMEVLGWIILGIGGFAFLINLVFSVDALYITGQTLYAINRNGSILFSILGSIFIGIGRMR